MSPNVYIIAGPNGAGKTTFARKFLPRYANCRVFINADLIAQGLSPFAPEQAAFHAGRLVLEQIQTHARRGDDFGFETTLSGRAHLRVIRDLKDRSYKVHLFYIWVPTEELTLARIKDRVLQGGHDIPEHVVHRRFDRSLINFFGPYRRAVDRWILFENAGPIPREIASFENGELLIENGELYTKLQADYGNRD